MKKIIFAIMAFAALFSLAACNDTETYKEQRDRELDSIPPLAAPAPSFRALCKACWRLAQA